MRTLTVNRLELAVDIECDSGALTSSKKARFLHQPALTHGYRCTSISVMQLIWNKRTCCLFTVAFFSMHFIIALHTFQAFTCTNKNRMKQQLNFYVKQHESILCNDASIIHFFPLDAFFLLTTTTTRKTATTLAACVLRHLFATIVRFFHTHSA